MTYGTINVDQVTNSDGVTSGGLYGFKNRIINGAMMIDQRNAGASGTTTNAYTVDRWSYAASQASKGTWQQNAGSVTPPSGFSNYLGFTSSSAYSVGSTDYFTFRQPIEGFNFADFSWGTSGAKAVTVSFWVRSSLTGTFCVNFSNTNGTRCYPATYTISSANTWEQKTVTVAGDTTGTWIGATNGVGLFLDFPMGVGSTYSGPANAWAGSLYLSATGATSVVGTNGATFYITGVQLEKGSTATSFDYRPYGTELALCQRYTVVYGGNNIYEEVGYGFAYSTTAINVILALPVAMRAAPSSSSSGSWQGSDGTIGFAGTGLSYIAAQNGNQQVSLGLTCTGLTQFRPYRIETANSLTPRLILSAEL